MSTNPFFNNFNHLKSQNLLANLAEEVISTYGMTMIYLPRSVQAEDEILNEDPVSSFTTHYEIPFYIENVDQFGGEGDFLQKFGLEIKDQATLVVSRQKFKLVTGLTNPTEGDLVYFPLTQSLFEVKFVEHEDPFFQGGTLQVYKLQIELYEFSHEKIETGVPEVDEIDDDLEYVIHLVMGAGSGTYTVGEQVYQGANLGAATAKATVVSWTSGTSTLVVRDIFGTFVAGINVVGDSSGADYTLSSVKTQFDDSEDIETDADAIIVDDSNPFGNPK